MGILPLFCTDMPRKLRFYQPKQRKDDRVIPQPAPLSEKAELLLSPLRLPLSLPLSVYLSAELPDLPSLRNHLASQTLPAGWVQHVDPFLQNCLIFASLRVNPDLLTATTTFVVKMDSTLKWSMSCYSNLVEVEQCCALAAMPRSVKSASALLRLLTTISECHICSGNPAAEFGELVEAHGGLFKDASGMCVCVY